MPKPSSVPTWSTQANYTTNPDPAAIGQPTKLDPGSLGVQGWTHMSRPNPRHFNFLQNAVGLWLSWINTDVLSTEGGNYTLNAPLNFSNQGIGIGAGAEFTVAADGFFYLNGPGLVTATGQLAFGSGAELTLDSGAVADVNTGAEVAFNTGSDLTFASGSDISGTARFGGTSWTWNAAQVLSSTVTNTGAGHSVDRTILGSDADVTFGINDYDEVAVPTLTADRTWGLSTTGAVDGCRMRFTAWGNASAFDAAITTAEGTYNMRNVTTLVVCLDIIFRSGAWHTSNVVRWQA